MTEASGEKSVSVNPLCPPEKKKDKMKIKSDTFQSQRTAFLNWWFETPKVHCKAVLFGLRLEAFNVTENYNKT